jgi:sec-independent protein translocase protein TatC
VAVGAFVVSAVVTPPDVFSQLILAVPLIILYELGVIAARVVGVKRAAPAEPESEAAK